MKIRVIILVLLFAFIQNIQVFCQGYYYQNRYIKLEKRLDGFTIISKTKGFVKESLRSELEKLNYEGEKIAGIEENFALIKLSGKISESDLRNIQLKYSKALSDVKFISDVYYGESKSVTQLITDEFVVKLIDNKNQNRLEMLNLLNNVNIKGVVNDGKAFILKTNDLSKDNALELSEKYFNTGLFEYAEPNLVYLAEGFFNWTPNDALYNLQWPLNNTGQSVPTGGYTAYGDAVLSNGFPDADMDVDLAWNYTKGNQNVIVAVFDTGVDSLHPDLKENLIVGYNAYANTNTNTIDTGSHGTCCLGIIGARSNNSTGVSGIVGGDNGSNHCKVCSYRLIDNSGTFVSNTNIARAFDTARVRGVHVSSNSWGGGSANTTLTNAINNLSNNGRGGLGCVVLFASGNDGRQAEYPSYLSSVVCVGASTNIDSKKSPGTGDQFWWGGCFGEDANGDLDLVAPTITTTTDRRGSLGYSSTDYDSTFNGTSCATPNAAGVAALIFSVNSSLTKSQVLDYLYRGCDKIDNLPYSTLKTYGKWNPYTGYGRVNAHNSVRLAAGVDVTPPAINHSSLSTVTASTYPLLISAEITDQDGSSVPVSGENAPLLYFRKNLNNAGWSDYSSVYASSNSGNTFYFQIPSSGWQTEIQYYILAKDNSGNQSLFPKNSPEYPCYTAIGNTTVTSGTFASFTLPTSGTAVSSNLNIADYKMLDVSVTLNLTHSYISDMSLQVWSPVSDTKINRVCLFSENGGSGANITNAAVSDGGTSFWRQSTPPYTNLSAKPDHYFSAFRGQSSGGNWKLLYYDGYSGDGGSLSNAVLNITRLNGTTSSCIKKDAVTDSLVTFFAFPGEKDTMSYYLKNRGTSNLIVSSYNFSGDAASNYSVINSPQLSVLPNDSSLFRILFMRPSGKNQFDKIGKSDFPLTEEAVLNINNNDPSKPVFKISLYNEAPLPVKLLSFNSEISGRNVILKWMTSNEANNAGFYIERCISSEAGNGNWNVVGFINGSGTVNETKNYLFEDKKLESGKYLYRLKQTDYNGSFEYHALSGFVEIAIPSKFELSQNYPNPFNPVSKFDVAMPENGNISIKIIDITGREVSNLFSGYKQAGYHTFILDASKLSSGIYFYTAVMSSEKNRFAKTKKMAVIK